MKATISSKGVLEIKAETETEQYALKKWFDGYTKKETESINIDISELTDDENKN